MSPEHVHYPKAQDYYNLEKYSKPKKNIVWQYIESPRRLLLINTSKAQNDYCLSIYQKPKTIIAWQYIQSPNRLLFGKHFI